MNTTLTGWRKHYAKHLVNEFGYTPEDAAIEAEAGYTRYPINFTTNEKFKEALPLDHFIKIAEQ